MLAIAQSTAWNAPLQAYLSSDHVSPATGKTIAITLSKNGGAYGNPSGGATNATEIANGSYYVGLTTTDTATLGPLFVRGTASGVDDVILILNIVKATNGGLTALPDTACTANASLLTSGTGTAQITAASGQVTVATNNDKTGYTASTVSDKTGYSLSASQTCNITGNLSGSVGSVTGLTASDVGTIKTQTDKMTFTVANQIDSNIQYVNDVQIKGVGTSGNPWGPV